VSCGRDQSIVTVFKNIKLQSGELDSMIHSSLIYIVVTNKINHTVMVYKTLAKQNFEPFDKTLSLMDYFNYFLNA